MSVKFQQGNRKKNGYPGTSIEFSRVQLIYFNTLFLTDFRQVSERG